VRFCSIGSGSKGNGTLVSAGSTTLLIDNGFTLKEFENRLAQKGLTPLDLTAVLITHEHGDHIKGVGPLARKYKVPVYCSHGTAMFDGLGSIPSLRVLNSHEPLALQDILVTPVVVPHDAKEPTQFVLQSGGHKLGILTDLGSLTPHILKEYDDCHALLLETNHDPQLLQMGPYPPKLKARVGGPLGHLSNAQAAQFLHSVNHDNLKYLVATHISEQNNDRTKAIAAISEPFDWSEDFVIMADQEKGFDWCEL